MNKAILISPLLLLLFIVPSAHAFVKILTLPDTKVGSIVTASGTSAPSNETRTNCDVQLNVNALGYQKTTPVAPDASYTDWKYTGTINTPSIQEGENKITAKIECFASGTNSTDIISGIVAPNFVHHHSENVTGVP